MGTGFLLFFTVIISSYFCWMVIDYVYDWLESAVNR